MSNERLHVDLAGLADEVAPADLRDRILRTSHRLAVRRAVASAVVAVVAIGVIAAGTAAALSTRSGHGAPVTSNGPSIVPSTAPAPSTSPTLSTTAPAIAPSTVASTSTSALPWNPRIPGTTYSVAEVGDQSGQISVELHAFQGGVDRTVTTIDGECPYETFSVSPGGSYVAWISGNPGLGELYVARSDMSGETDVEAADCSVSQVLWQSDTSFVITPATDGELTRVDAATGKVTKIGLSGELYSYSPNGKYIVGLAPAGQHYAAKIDGSGERTFGYTLPSGVDGDGWGARGVSNDGRYVAVGPNGTGGGRSTVSTGIVDVTTGKVVKLPVPDVPRFVAFLPDGDVLVVTEKSYDDATPVEYALLNSSLHLITTQKLDPLPWHGTWIGYVP